MSSWRRFAICVFASLVVLGSASLAAQTQQNSTESDLAKRLQSLEQKLEQLENRVNAALPANTPAAPAGSDRLDQLDKKLQLIERNQQSTQPKNTPTVSADAGGFAITSADKAFKLKVGGYGQADGKTFYNDRSHALGNSFSVRRARLNFDATVGKYVDIRIAPEFGNGSLSLFDAYADLKFNPFSTLRAGKFKTPIGLEMLQNDTDLTFIERSLVSDLVPNRDEGFQVYGDVAWRISYQFAVVNGGPDGTNIDGDSNDGKDFVARMFATPFAKSGPKALNGLGFGLGMSTGRQNGSVLPSLKSTGGQAAFFSYLSAASAAGNRLRYTPQLYYYYGPFGVVAEYAVSSQQVKATETHFVTNHAWQVAGSWMVTGEKKGYGRFTPKKSSELTGLSTSLRGAFEIAGRYSELNVDPAVFKYNYADATKSAEAARQWTIGTNYYIGRNVRLSLDFEHTRFLKGATTGNRPDENAFEQRLQVVF